ncbi:IQ calmodulin-binding motif family protein, putative [Ichthyophthirius multifiliis]|uniref:IQ calmodulin-binding motif family protein, putative n=1 Tax=Ichthyophthirius multifiliis TaxID=5932 RepID=G0QRL9_ICHMU|nr:IQ calmodulin-binding motif family protein, putative [Ichthyophthirius multifiliis]EGR32140.1 IQ calmodulin-binding motif family protein, putative [Ichthyophthirius multifiliis]|eukprot:XP_004035626.1 IQ calmodulin-binding motif family protein, putative [Ichthyophthirius multifiliis]
MANINGQNEFKRETMVHFHQKENTQIGRIFNLKDPKVSIIYVSAYQLQQEIISYYHKICELAQIPDYINRLHFIYPENSQCFPKIYNTNKLLYYSPMALKKIKKIISNKYSYIIPGNIQKQDILISIQLNVPVYAGDLDTSQKLNSKTHSRHFFKEIGLPIPAGIENIGSEDELFTKLTYLIIKYPQINTWIFKTDYEQKGRGTAYIELEHLRVIKDFKKQKISEENVLKLREIISTLLPQKIVICFPSLFANYQEFLEYFVYNKGLIEAFPQNNNENEVKGLSVSFKIDPDGVIKPLCAFEKISLVPFVNFGAIFPQNVLPLLNLKALCEKIGVELKKRGVFGYINADLVAFQDPENSLGHKLFYLNGLDCFLNDFMSAFFMFQMVSGSKMDQVSGKYYLSDQNEQESNYLDEEEGDFLNIIKDFDERSFFFVPYICHEGFFQSNFKEFFIVCRKFNISYDIEKKQGTLFLLLDQLKEGVLGVLGIGEKIQECMQFIYDVFIKIQQMFENEEFQRKKKNQKESIVRNDEVSFQILLKKIKSLYQEYRGR